MSDKLIPDFYKSTASVHLPAYSSYRAYKTHKNVYVTWSI